MRVLTHILVLTLALLFVGCEERTEETDSGGVLLEVEFVDSIFRVGVNDTSLVSIPTVTIDSIVARPGGSTSELMNVQLDVIEVTFSRADTGTRVPLPFVFNVIGTVPVGGTLSYNDLPIMSSDQLRGEPLGDLLFENGAIDRETGASTIKLNVTVRVFGRTIGGSDISSNPRTQTIEFVPSLATTF
ncbi:MAG: hypothetical protein AAGN66_06110 [Acidobacteriota bacterium]